jgi:hypothetical protein
MNKFQKLAQLNRDIELLESAGKIKAADILHQKFIKEAQYPMPMAYNPFMVNPLMYSMMARPVVNPAGTAGQPTVQAPTVQTPTVQTPATQPPTTPATNPQATAAPPATTSAPPTTAPASGQVNPAGIKPGTPPSSLTRSTNQQGQGGFMQGSNGKITIIGDDGNPISYVAPPGSTIGPGLRDINPTPSPTPKPAPSPSPGPPPSGEMQGREGGYYEKIRQFFDRKPRPSEQEGRAFMGRIQGQLEKELREKRLTQEQIDFLLGTGNSYFSS